ncbi:concanavalin A-like lectin/glucanases family protein [Leptospira vanthielii serovar Holland str. Waz Holland = ATCC 700522]|uniref:Concanavalin A-like lectin/glucanases family protein n=3 Tax=Leptospira vanthielii TaxID=293085 RepID=N1WI30_9LEPT|nr:concanavalin A-like lectin/glucanases family protein [Leptospira vanthielii serovar Holland str. Waz Holland = ATCC 700522]
MIIFSVFFCKPSDLQNVNDVNSREFNETQMLNCLLIGPFCTRGVVGAPIQPLVQLDFTNGSLVNSGPVVFNLSSQEWVPNLTTGKDGDANGGINFDTNNRYYSSNLGQDASLPMGANPRTMCAWIKPSQLPANGSHQLVFRYGSTTTANASVLALSTATGNKVSFLGFGYDALADYTVPLNTWTHLCASYNGGNTASLYVNGNLIGSPTFSGSGPLNTISGAFVIGTWTGSGGLPYYWWGDSDAMRIYDIALSAKQIGQIYQTGIAYVE